MSKYIKSPSLPMSNLVKHKKPRKKRMNDVRHLSHAKNPEHAKNITIADEFADEFHDDGKRRMKGYQHAQRSKITLAFVSILGTETKWNTKQIDWSRDDDIAA